MRTKRNKRSYKKGLFIVSLLVIILGTCGFQAHKARALNVKPSVAVKEEQGRWQNKDGTPCYKMSGTWVCLMPKDNAKQIEKKARPLSEKKTVTAYNSVAAQTDSTPCIAAYGDNICDLEKKGDHSCAAAYPYGTKLNIPNKGTCTVRDVLAPKYAHRVDWYEGGAEKIQSAKQFGKQILNVAIVYEN